jgi:hypothetical protein
MRELELRLFLAVNMKYHPKCWMVNSSLKKKKGKSKELVNRYSKRLPKEYLWGRDNCQLLITFESNIPNNSLAKLWASKYWTPLIERK